MRSASATRKFNLANCLLGLFILIFALVCILPMLLTLIVSFTDESTLQRYGFSFFPKRFSTAAYQMMFSKGSLVLHGYMISIFVTVVGTVAALVITALAAYTLADKNVKYRGLLGLLFFIPMVFSAGIVPWYLMCKQLGFYNNILALIIPSLLFNPFNLFLVRNYMQGIPDSLRESATIDGASDLVIATRIYFPLAMPVLATVGLFYALGYWNDWWNAIMLVDDRNFYPIQYMLQQLQSNVKMLQDMQLSTHMYNGVLPAQSLQMATVIITVGPIALLYPFLQKYYIQGLVVGSVKE